MPFSAKTLDFLFENRLNDSRNWFNEHKSDYTEYVKKPFEEFTAKLRPYIADIDEQCNVVRISRIYRDARYAKGKSIFRENMWCTFGRVRDYYQSLPCFYLDISANSFEYGCGYYMASTDTMNAYRQLILENSPAFSAALEAYKKQDIFELFGDMYKRNRFPNESEEKCLWLNRKSIGVTALSKDWELLFSDSLADKIGEDLTKIAPIYDLFMKAEEIAAEDKTVK